MCLQLIVLFWNKGEEFLSFFNVVSFQVLEGCHQTGRLPLVIFSSRLKTTNFFHLSFFLGFNFQFSDHLSLSLPEPVPISLNPS